MKKLLLSILLCICQGMVANAQMSIDVRGGLSLVRFGGSDAIAWSFMEDATVNWKPAFHLGGSLFFHNFTPVVLEGGLFYSAKGTIYKGMITDYQGGNEKLNIKTIKNLNYLDIPLHVRFYFKEHFNIYAGPELSFLLTANYTDKIEDMEDVTENVKDEYNSLDLSIDLGIVYQFNSGLNFQVGYEYGLLDIVKYEYEGTGYNVMNRGIKISIGYELFNPIKEEKVIDRTQIKKLS